MYKMILADGTEVKFDGVNGNNFIVPNQKEMDTDVFTDENLASGTVTDDDGNEYPFTNLSFTQQQKQRNGDYYICFHERTEQEVELAEIHDLLVQVAEVEVSAGNILLEDIKGDIQNEVRVKIDDSERLDK